MKVSLFLLFLASVSVLVVVSARTSVRYSLRVIGRTPTSIKLQFPDSGGGVLMYVVTRAARTQDPPWEVLVILPGNDVVSLTNLETNTSYTLRWRTDERVFSDVQVSTMDRLNFEIVATETSVSIASSSTRNIQTKTTTVASVTNQIPFRKCFECVDIFPSLHF